MHKRSLNRVDRLENTMFLGTVDLYCGMVRTAEEETRAVCSRTLTKGGDV